MTQRELAKQIGVSSATVSRVINNDPRVAEHTTCKVREAIEQYGYVQNNIARSLKTAKSNTVALVVSDITNTFFLDILCGVEEELSKSGYNIIIHNTELSLDRERQAVEMLMAYRMAGVIMNVVDGSGAILKPLYKAGIPTVLFDRKVEMMNTDCVVVDNYGGMEKMVAYLHDSNHKKIATIHGTINNTPGIERLDGYYRSMMQWHLPIQPSYVVSGEFHEKEGYMAMVALMELEDPPTAVIVQNNLMTIGAYKACVDMGVSIPEKVSLIGFDDFELGDMLTPPITVLRRPVVEMGVLSAQRLIRRMESRHKSDEIIPQLDVMPTELIIRSSCRRL